MSKFTYIIIYIFIWLLALLPFWLLYLLSDIIAFLLIFVFKYRRKIIYTNLKNSFPEKSEIEIREIAKKYYKHLCDVGFETIKLLHISKSEMKKRCVYKNTEIVDELLKQQKSIVSVIGHYGNWEYMLGFPLFTNYKVLTLYKPLSDKNFNQFYINLRSKFGVEAVSMKESYKRLIELKNEKTPTITAFISDQTPHRAEIQYWTKFLNQETPVFLGPEKISQKLNSVVLYFEMKKLKRGYYEMNIIKLFDNPNQTLEYEITNKHVELLEKTISKNPEFWLWSHKRWKTKKPINE